MKKTVRSRAKKSLSKTAKKRDFSVLRNKGGKWKITEIKSQGLTNAIGGQIEGWYEKGA